jgi:hypothetical protein
MFYTDISNIISINIMNVFRFYIIRMLYCFVCEFFLDYAKLAAVEESDPDAPGKSNIYLGFLKSFFYDYFYYIFYIIG